MWKKDEKVGIVFTNKSKSWWDIFGTITVIRIKDKVFPNCILLLRFFIFTDKNGFI